MTEFEPAQYRDGHLGEEYWADDESPTSDLAEYWALIKPWRRSLILTTLVAVIATSLTTIFVLPRWYLAQALLRPASQEGPTFQAGTLGLATGGLGSLGSMIGSQLGFGATANDAMEHLAILNSYDFNIRVIKGLNLKSHILPETTPRRFKKWLGFDPYSDWKLYEMLQKLLEAEYDDKSGNLTISYLDRDPATARRVLRAYIDGLRDMLRSRAINDSALAVQALEHQVSQTSDALMVNQLDQLIAQQLQTKMTAEMQADFAFTVIQPAMVPTIPDRPWFILDPLIAGIVWPMLFLGWIVFREKVSAPYQESIAVQDSVPEPAVPALVVEKVPAEKIEPRNARFLG